MSEEVVRSYYNDPSKTGNNACGQAAVVAMLDFYGVDALKVQRVQKVDGEGERGVSAWPNAEAINAVMRDYPPDYLSGVIGTTPDRVVRALRHYGLIAHAEQAHLPSSRHTLWSKLEASVNAGRPVITIVDRGRLGKPFTGGAWLDALKNRIPIAHWAIVDRIEGPYVHVANTKNASWVHKDTYWRAMYAWWMRPFAFGDCAIFVRDGGRS